MTTIRWKGNKVVIDDSIQDLPIDRYQIFNINVLLDAGIGSDVNAFGQRCVRIKRMIKTNPDGAVKEVDNMYQNVVWQVENVSPKARAFAALVVELNGEKIGLMSEGMVDEVVERLTKQRMPWSMLSDAVDRVKKNFEREFELFFPDMGQSADLKEFYDKLKARTKAVLKSVYDSANDFGEEISKLDAYFDKKLAPKVYGGSAGVEVTAIKNFERTCVLLRQMGLSYEPKRMTVLQFYEALEVANKQRKQSVKARRKSKSKNRKR